MPTFQTPKVRVSISTFKNEHGHMSTLSNGRTVGLGGQADIQQVSALGLDLNLKSQGSVRKHS